MLGQRAFQVGRIVFVDAAALDQLVDHAGYFGEELHGIVFIGDAAERFYCRAGRFFVKAVLQAALGILADTLEGGFVISHDV